MRNKMARLSDRVNLVTEAAFTNRIAMAAVIVAMDVAVEPDNAPYRPLRSNLASSVLADPIAHGRRLAAVVLADDALSDQAVARPTESGAVAALDAAIVQRIRTTWNVLSGVTDPNANNALPS